MAPNPISVLRGVVGGEIPLDDDCVRYVEGWLDEDGQLTPEGRAYYELGWDAGRGDRGRAPTDPTHAFLIGNIAGAILRMAAEATENDLPTDVELGRHGGDWTNVIIVRPSGRYRIVIHVEEADEDG